MSDILQLHSLFLYMCYKDSLSGIVGSVSSYTYTRWSVFCVGKIFLLNAVMQFFFHPVNKGETEGYVELTAEEIAVKRSLHFSFCSAVFFPVLPVLLAFSRHLNFQDILLVWVALTHRAKVVSHVQYFFFIPPPEFGPADEQVKPLYSPLYASFSCLTYLFCFIPKVALQQTERLKHAAEKVWRMFLSEVARRHRWIIRSYRKSNVWVQTAQVKSKKNPSYDNPVLLFLLNRRCCFSKYSFTLCMATFYTATLLVY